MKKVCFKCGETKALDAFYAHAQMGDGRLNKCKDCTKKDVRQHRLANPETVRENDRKRGASPHRVAARQKAARNEKEQNPDRWKARVTLGNAVRDGRVKKLPCAFCAAENSLEAHHHDYSKPLDVTWLCTPCHRRFHTLERIATYREDRAA